MTRRSDVSSETFPRPSCVPAKAEPGSEPGPELRRALLAHYDAHRRDLPWRRTSDPYAIWVSEVMLQQTRVETVEPYWRRWMERFPTVGVLADAPLDDVLGEWEGLGYYSRARSLHRAAGIVAERHGGELPDTAAALRELPGIGPYTAGALASIAFGRPEPAVDGNVRRVLARWYDLKDPGAAELRELAADLVDPDRPGDWNQALMELGAVVCTPRDPSCEVCPVADHCRARAAGTQEERPLPRKRAPVPRRRHAVAVVVRRTPAGADSFLLRRRSEDGMLGGLWEFPAREMEEGESGGAAARLAAAEAGVGVERAVGGCPEVTQTYSHVVIRYRPWVFTANGTGTATEAPEGPGEAEVRWVDEAGLADLPLPRAQRRIARHVLNTLSW